MQRTVLALALLVTAVSCATSVPDPMSQESLAKHIEEITGSAKTSPNVVEFQYNGIAISCVSDATHDRMRLIHLGISLSNLARSRSPLDHSGCGRYRSLLH